MPSTHIHKTCRLLLAAAIMAMTGIITSSCFHTMHAHPEAISNNPDARKAVTEKESWKCVFTGLPLRDKNNEPILYRVAENTIPGYSISQRKTEPAQSGSLLSCRNTSYIILNHREPSTTSVIVKTSWNDSMDHEKLRPKQTKVQLYANGIPYGGKRILDSSNGWKCHFKDLPVNTGGNRISYTAAQEWVPDGYQESLSADENGTMPIPAQAPFSIAN